ncbi:Choline transporter-like [Parasponia andersonii]|uniref:Choline transporter-like n=1 Tax=Parasponia andersonii TaxID=3476 RepID=A0A2P5CNC0_PARAD|nr:Choline transporter-like [Parasponia andersonii]
MWVSATAIKLLKGPKIEFMCSCANCYTGYASMLVIRIGLEELIDSDRTGTFCFLSRVAVGAICSLSRITMAWQQACLAVYYVAFAKNPQNPKIDSTIPNRIQELQRLQDSESQTSLGY